jgi:hypothetical protein
MSIELSDIDVIAGERSLPGRWRLGVMKLDVSERPLQLMARVHAMQWQGPVEGAVKRWWSRSSLRCERYFACRLAGLDSDLRHQDKWSSYSR